jgi:hypothetical protein
MTSIDILAQRSSFPNGIFDEHERPYRRALTVMVARDGHLFTAFCSSRCRSGRPEIGVRIALGASAGRWVARFRRP